MSFEGANVRVRARVRVQVNADNLHNACKGTFVGNFKVHPPFKLLQNVSTIFCMRNVKYTSYNNSRNVKDSIRDHVINVIIESIKYS